MRTSGLAIKEEPGRQETTNIDLTYRVPEKGTKGVNMLGRIKNILGRVVTVDEEWIFKSRDWPYLWTKK
ncbi:hypothetical protein ACFLUJ_05780 [Chloroflexota bacterium]